MPGGPICLFASSPEVRELGFLVQVLAGTPAELAERSVALGYDGFEFMPDPERVPDPEPFRRALRDAGAVLPVVNTGRMASQKIMLFDPRPESERKALRAFRRILDFAGALGAQVGLGIARGPAIPGLSAEAMDRHAEDLFRELAAHAQRAGTAILLEAAESKVTRYIATMEEVMRWVDRIGSPAFAAMLDTQQLADSEPTIEHGLRVAARHARHIHLFDPGRQPPGIRPDGLDWDRIFSVLREEGFQGSASVALVPEGDVEPSARRVADFLRNRFCLSLRKWGLAPGRCG
jgi:sugar phosphate isomerase/epimerase